MKKNLLKKLLSFALAFFLVISFIPNEIKAADEKTTLLLGTAYQQDTVCHKTASLIRLQTNTDTT